MAQFKAEEASLKNYKIQFSGRLDGRLKATSFTVRQGVLPLQQISAKISYASEAAVTKYGSMGVKVWILL